jgi:hypothetical protein
MTKEAQKCENAVLLLNYAMEIIGDMIRHQPKLQRNSDLMERCQFLTRAISKSIYRDEPLSSDILIRTHES